jgi:hypothetical protein
MSQFEQDLLYLWENFRVEPTYLQMEMSQFRKFIVPRNDLQDYAIKFIAETKDVPDTAIVVITSGKLTLLVDEQGNLLEFA